MGASRQGVTGLVEANVAVRAYAEQLKIESTGLGDHALVALALGVRIACLPVQEGHLIDIQPQFVEQGAFEKTAKAADIAVPEPNELIDLERPHPRPLGRCRARQAHGRTGAND